MKKIMFSLSLGILSLNAFSFESLVRLTVIGHSRYVEMGMYNGKSIEFQTLSNLQGLISCPSKDFKIDGVKRRIKINGDCDALVNKIRMATTERPTLIELSPEGFETLVIKKVLIEL